jgi:hypothetical protein
MAEPDRRKSRFLVHTSHQLRSARRLHRLVNAIMGFASIEASLFRPAIETAGPSLSVDGSLPARACFLLLTFP